MATNNEQAVALIDALEAVFRPLMPLLRTFGVTHLDLSQMLTRLYIYDSAETLAKEGRALSAARLAIMNGVTRGEVEKHLAVREETMRRKGRNTTQLMAPAAVLSMWNTDSRFSTPYGVAVDLPLQPGTRQRSFKDLVDVAAPGSDAEAVLDALVAAGCVQVHDDGDFVSCSNRAYTPAEIGSERLSRVGTVLGGLAANMTRNLLLTNGEASDFERVVHTDFAVSEEGVLKIREWLKADGLRFLETLDAWITVNQEDLKGDSGKRVGVSLFMYEDADEVKDGFVANAVNS